MSGKYSRISVLTVGVVVGLLFAGCTPWFWNKNTDTAPKIQEINVVTPEKVVISELDIDRPYTMIGDVSTTFTQMTPLNAAPTKELVDAKLKIEAAKIGADAIIYVRYNKLGGTWKSWSSMEGKGQAVKFKYY